MNWKPFLGGMACMVMLLLTVGGALGAIQTEGNTVSVPMGKFMIYFTLDLNDLPRIVNAAEWIEQRDGLTNSQAVTVLNREVKACVIETIIEAENDKAMWELIMSQQENTITTE